MADLAKMLVDDHIRIAKLFRWATWPTTGLDLAAAVEHSIDAHLAPDTANTGW